MKNKIVVGLVIVAIISLVCGICIFIFNKETKSEDYDEITDKVEEIQDTKKIENTEFMELWETNVIGTLEIPSINLKLSIAEGIEDDVLAKYIGHFPSTALINGNVAQQIGLQSGDEIIKLDGNQIKSKKDIDTYLKTSLL